MEPAAFAWKVGESGKKDGFRFAVGRVALGQLFRCGRSESDLWSMRSVGRCAIYLQATAHRCMPDIIKTVLYSNLPVSR